MKKMLVLAALLFASSVQAQAWPSKAGRVIVNVAPGGVADVTARVLGARLQETLDRHSSWRTAPAATATSASTRSGVPTRTATRCSTRRARA